MLTNTLIQLRQCITGWIREELSDRVSWRNGTGVENGYYKALSWQYDMLYTFIDI